jgi:hypothetical protein
LLEQAVEARTTGEVAAVVCEILGHEVELHHAPGLQGTRLIDQRCRVEGAVTAAPQRYCAEGAAVVAPLADLEVRDVTQSTHRQAGAGVPARTLVEQAAHHELGNELGQVAEPEE